MLDSQTQSNLASKSEYSSQRMNTPVPIVLEDPLGIVKEQSRSFEELQISLMYRIAKRGLDISGALIGLAVLAFLLPIIALLIWREDRGVIFYRYVCIGQYGKPFNTY